MKELPRQDLREPAFRRYEKLIAKACTGPIIGFRPKEVLGQSPHTFMTRFRDALLGMRKYGYTSNLIPTNVELRFDLRETEDGTVNIYPLGQAKLGLGKGLQFNRDEVLETINAINSGRMEGVQIRTGVTEDDVKWFKEKIEPTNVVLQELEGDVITFS